MSYNVLVSRVDNNKVLELIENLKTVVVGRDVFNFGEMGFLYTDEREHGPRIKQIKFSSTYNHIESFLEDIEFCISKINKDELFDEECGYQFPSESTIKFYGGIHEMDADEHFANESAATVVECASRLTRRVLGDRRFFDNLCVTGKVGSGKTTFVEYFIGVLAKNIQEGDGSFISSAVISYSDVKSRFRECLSMNDWRILFEIEILDQVIYKGFKFLGSRFRDKKDFALSIKSWLEKRSAMGVDSPDSLGLIYNIIENVQLNSWGEYWNESFVRENILEEVKRLLLRYLVEAHDMKVVVFFDGFDAFSLDKLIHKNHTGVVDYFRGFVFIGRRILGLSQDEHVSIISLRDCTYSRFMKTVCPEDDSRVERWRICPPGVKKSMYRGIKSYFKQLLSEESDGLNSDIQTRECKDKYMALQKQFIKLFDKVHEEVKNEFDTSDDDIVKIFNQNYRRLKSYYILIIKKIVADLIKKEGPINRDDFFFRMSLLDIGSVLNKHEFLELLILKESKLFYNYYSDVDFGYDGIHAEPVVQRGLVDNVFGYSVQQFGVESTVPTTLLKVRVLQFLYSVECHVKPCDVLDEMMRLGYFLDSVSMSAILDVLVEIGFVKNRFSEELRTIVYSCTALGSYVINELLFNNRYIEHVLQKTLLPKDVLRLMHPMCKYCGNVSVVDWVFYSTINIYVLFNYIDFLERSELDWYETEVKDGYECYMSRYSLRSGYMRAIDSLEVIYMKEFAPGHFMNIEELLSNLSITRDILRGI